MKNHIIARFISIQIIFIVVMTMIPLTRVAARGDHLDDTLDGNGKLSTDFALGDDIGHDVAIQADGKIVAVGLTGGNIALTRYHPNGSLDTTFSGDGRVTGPVGVAYAVAIQPDGKIVVAGYTSEQIATQVFIVARFLTNGNPDNSFNGNGRATVGFPAPGINVAVATCISIQSNGYLVLAGYRLTADGNNAFHDWAIARFSGTGLLDPLFSDDGKTTVSFDNTNGLESASAVTVMPDGKILLAGTANDDSNLDFALARLNIDGTPDTTFDMDGKIRKDFGTTEKLNDMKLQPDGKIVAAGTLANRFAVARFNATGTPDTSFDLDGVAYTLINPGGGTATANGLVIQSDGKIVLAGTRATIQGNGDYMLARYMPDGTLDPAFGQLGVVITDLNAGSDDEGADIILQPDGKYVVVGTTENTGAGHNNIALARYMPNFGEAPYDFDGDRKTDISVFRPSGGTWWINRSSTGATFAAQFGASTDRIAPADFTGDGKTDIAFWRPSNGFWFALRSEDSTFFAFPFGLNGDIPAPADYDNDGKADAAIFRPSNSVWYIQRSTGGTHIEQFGLAGDVPVAADYDGDGRTDIAIFRPSNGQWWINRSTAGILAVSFGTSTDKPTQGDFTGDGKADIALWRPSTGDWFVLRSEDFSFFGFPFGLSTDIPAPGDYDGDGKFDATVFRPSNATWFVQRSSGGTTIAGFGLNGDRPVANAFVP